jgi:lipoprotein-anchoring transpeptidase ErfK/SrfK
MMRVKAKAAAAFLALWAAAAPAAAQEKTTPPERSEPPADTRPRGLILSSVEAAATRPVERIEDFSLVVDLSERQLYVLSGDEVVRSWPVAVGESSYPTPTGDFRIRRMQWNPSWTPPPSAWARDRHYEAPGAPGNPMGRVKIFFRAPDFYIHGTGHAGSLGRAASHGCIRMRNIDAVELARMVMVNGDTERDAEWFQKVIDESTVTREVALERPVAIKIRR